MTTVTAAIADTEAQLARAGVSSAQAEARQLLAWVCDCALMELFFLGPQELSSAQEAQLAAAVARRCQREPLQHIVGTANFYGQEFWVGPGVFIPRPETEVLAQWGIAQAQNFARPRIVDFCTGSGALAATLAREVPGAQVQAVELSPQAYEYAKRNVPEDVRVVPGDVTDPGIVEVLGGPASVDVLVSNPPYVPAAAEVSPEVAHDPATAVFGGASGMDVIEGTLPLIVQLLVPGGFVGIEHDDATQDLVVAALHATGAFQDIQPLADLAGRPRFVVAQKLVE